MTEAEAQKWMAEQAKNAPAETKATPAPKAAAAPKKKGRKKKGRGQAKVATKPAPKAKAPASFGERAQGFLDKAAKAKTEKVSPPKPANVRTAGRKAAVDYLRKSTAAPSTGKLAQKAASLPKPAGAIAAIGRTIGATARVAGTLFTKGPRYALGATAALTGAEAVKAGKELGEREQHAAHVQKKTGVKITRKSGWLLRAATGRGPGFQIHETGKKGTGYKPAIGPPRSRRR